MNPKKIAKLISENIDEVKDAGGGGEGPAMDPVHFAKAVNAVIAASPHGQQAEAIQKLIKIGQQDKGKLIDVLEKIETNVEKKDMAYIQDFYRTKPSHIRLLTMLAETAYDNEEAIDKVLDAIDLGTDFSDEEEGDDEDLYNSEGDGYSH